MELIRLYYDSIDVQPSVLIRHFARYLGLYVEENIDKENVDSESLADIYIISNEYFKERDTLLEIPYENKTILVLKDGFSTEDTRVKTVDYSDDSEDDYAFLHELMAELCGVIKKSSLSSTALMLSDKNCEECIDYLAQAYLSSNILQASLFNRCFYKEKILFGMAIEKYKEFIREIEKDLLLFGHSDLFEYALTYAKYEMNIICKNNWYQFAYSSKDLLNKCGELLDRHPENEELYLLKADIRLRLKGEYLQACKEFADSHVEHCAYADYRNGKIRRKKLKEYDNAEYLLKNAIMKKKDYVYAWYQLGVCYKEQAKYQEAFDAFDTIVEILREKYTLHLLAPMELEYLYKAVMQITAIYINKLGDYMSGYAYMNLAKEIKNENAIEKYLLQTWKGLKGMDGTNVFAVINDTLNKEIDHKCEKIY